MSNCSMIVTVSTGDSCPFNDFLPDEIVRKIFLLLSCDLKSVSQVCTRWREICSEPKLWKNFRLCINYKNVEMVRELMSLPRLKVMRSVKFLSWFVSVDMSESVIMEIFKHSDDVDELIIRGNGLVSGNGLISDLNPFLLANCLNRMTWLSREQLNLIFYYMNKETKIAELKIENNLSGVDKNILAECGKKLKIVSLN